MFQRMSWISVERVGLAGAPRFRDVALVDCPDIDHVAAAPRDARLHPDVGEDDTRMGTGHRVFDRGLELGKNIFDWVSVPGSLRRRGR